MPIPSSWRFVRFLLLCLPVALLFGSCASSRYYNQRTMFRLTDANGRQLDSTKLRLAVNRTERNYLIQANDYLDVRVYTNKGERILDPNGELQFGRPSATTIGRSNSAGSTGRVVGAGTGAGTTSSGSEFLVQADGTVILPMLMEKVRVSGLSLIQADSLLKIRYDKFYTDAFVMTRVANNRVIVLGSPGGQVITLANDNMNLLEVLALAGGIDGGGTGGTLYRNGGRASNIRVIRGDLKNPRVQQIDLTTLDGMRRANLQVEPNDIIYVEPVRRPFLDGLLDVNPLINLTSLALSVFVTVYSIAR